MSHIVASNGFGKMVHEHPHTRERWTRETVEDWRRRCAGRGRSGGILIEIEECDCPEYSARDEPTALPVKAMGVCRVCQAPLVWAVTLASETGAGGKRMPLDAEPNPAGNVAVRQTGPRSLVARVLGNDETADVFAERVYMPHFATCAGAARNIGAVVEAFLRSHPSTEEGS